jgi:hypothetical protein
MGSTKFSTSTALALAAVLVSSSTAIYAVSAVPKASVGAKQLRTSAVTNSKIAPAAVSNSKIGKHAVTNSKIGKYAVTNSKMGKWAITSSKVKPNSLGGTEINESALGPVPTAANAATAGNAARLEGQGAAAFVGAPRMAFGKGSASSTAAATVLSLPNLGVTVATDGDTDNAPDVVVSLPSTSPAFSWIVSSEGSPMFSTSGGAPLTLSAASGTNSLTAHIWRSDSAAGLYLHCAFDTTGFTTARPLSCWAFST